MTFAALKRGWALALAFRRALSERHLLISLKEAAAAPLFSRHGWDGAVVEAALLGDQPTLW